MKQGSNLDLFTSVPCDSLRLPSQGVGQPRRVGEALRTPSLPPFFSDRQLSGSDSFLELAAPGWGWQPRPGGESGAWSGACRSSGGAAPYGQAPWKPRWYLGPSGAHGHYWPSSVPSRAQPSALGSGPHHRYCCNARGTRPLLTVLGNDGICVTFSLTLIVFIISRILPVWPSSDLGVGLENAHIKLLVAPPNSTQIKWKGWAGLQQGRVHLSRCRGHSRRMKTSCTVA